MKSSISKVLLSAVLSISVLTAGVAMYNDVARNNMESVKLEYNMVCDLPDLLAVPS